VILPISATCVARIIDVSHLAQLKLILECFPHVRYSAMQSTKLLIPEHLEFIPSVWST
jgi:hypothetical protein